METNLNSVQRENGQYLLFEDDSGRDPLCVDIFFDDGPFGLLLLDRYFQVVRANRKFVRITGFALSKLLGRPIFDLLEEENALRLKSILQNGNTLNPPLSMYLSFIREDEELLIVEGYLRRYTDDHDRFNLCILLFDEKFSSQRRPLEMRDEIYQTIIDTQEEERKNIGTTLHDSVAQLLYGMRLNLQRFVLEHGYADRMMPIKKMLNEVIHQIRTVSKDLFPSVIDEFGLGPAINAMADRFSFPGFKVITMLHGDCEQLPRRMKLSVYRIVQELLNNCMKHAFASRVLIRINSKADTVNIEVTDNGKGFTGKIDQRIEDGTGIRNIHSRIKLYKGNIRIEDNGPGTKVTVSLNTYSIKDTEINEKN